VVQRRTTFPHRDYTSLQETVLSYKQRIKTWNCYISKAMGIILGSLSQGMCQHILSLGYRTPWEMIEGINKDILKSNWSQDYTDLTYLISTKMGANENVTDYFARLLELSLRNFLISGRVSSC